MKISSDQMTVVIDSVKFQAVKAVEVLSCIGCEANFVGRCYDFPCGKWEREDGKSMVFVKAEPDLSDADKWDNRELGADEEFVEVASDEQHAALKAALGKDKSND